MTRWPGAFPVFVDRAAGARLGSVGLVHGHGSLRGPVGRVGPEIIPIWGVVKPFAPSVPAQMVWDRALTGMPRSPRSPRSSSGDLPSVVR